MPDSRTHFIAGTVCGAVGSLVIQDRLHENKKLDPVHFLLSTGSGAAASRLPDIFEPAVHPNHRAFFHSFTFGALLGFSAVRLVRKINEKKAERKKRGIEQITGLEILLGLLFIAIIVFLLHLLMDGFTKKGLPFI